MKLKTLLTAAATALAFAVAPAHAEKIIKLHHLNADDPFESTTGAMVTVFKNLVEAGTGGSVKVQTFPNGQLGKDNEVLSQVKAGLIQSGVFSVGGFASTYPMIGVLDLPFTFPDISTTYAVFDGPVGKKLGADIEQKTGMEVLGFGDSGGFFAITNSKKAIKTPDDMKGLPALAKKMTVTTLTPAEKAAFRDAAQPAVKAYISETFGKEGEEMLGALQQAVEAASK